MLASSRDSARLWAVLMLLLLAGGGVEGQGVPRGERGERLEEVLVLHAYTLKHQRASDAVPLIHPLLSEHGTVELQPGDNTLVIRDSAGALSRILPVLRSFDHAPRALRVEIMIVRASRSAVSPPMNHSDLPEDLTRKLRKILLYDNYDLEAQALLQPIEGEAVTYEIGEGYQVAFRLGTVLPDRRVRLADFEIGRRFPRRQAQELLHTNLNLWLDQTMSLGLAKSEGSREALMVVLTLKDGRP
ncbi:MAG TPA: secretin N-terminal domain-containing protein [Thermoanaerobaculia bacterium]|nr:secretin N-terminal domain-containing protein [Thermoanaerobaculia bacterium]